MTSKLYPQHKQHDLAQEDATQKLSKTVTPYNDRGGTTTLLRSSWGRSALWTEKATTRFSPPWKVYSSGARFQIPQILSASRSVFWPLQLSDNGSGIARFMYDANVWCELPNRRTFRVRARILGPLTRSAVRSSRTRSDVRGGHRRRLARSPVKLVGSPSVRHPVPRYGFPDTRLTSMKRGFFL